MITATEAALRRCFPDYDIDRVVADHPVTGLTYEKDLYLAMLVRTAAKQGIPLSTNMDLYRKTATIPTTARILR